MVWCECYTTELLRQTGGIIALAREPDYPASRSQQRGVVALFEAHDLFLHDFHVLRQLEKRLHDLGFGRLVGEGGEQGMNARHAGGEGVAGGADVGNGGGSVHAAKHVAAGLDAQAGGVAECAA